MCKASLIAFLRFCTLHVGKEINNVIPLKFHPGIPFSMDHAPLPLTIFLVTTESPPL